MKMFAAAIVIAAVVLSCSGISMAQGHKKTKPVDAAIAAMNKRADAFNKRPIYKKLTVAIINKIKDGDLLQAVFDNIAAKMKPDMSDDLQVIMSLSRGRQSFYMIWVLESEVNNGGFNQYYYNSSGRYKLMTPEALNLVGAGQYAELVSKANDVYDTNAGTIKKYQDGTMEGFSKSYDNNPLDKLDDQYYALSKKTDLEKLMIAFIRKNKKQFADE